MENVQESINPFSERVFEEYPLQSVEQCLGLLPEVERAQNEWTTTSIEQRTEILEQCASHLRKHKGDLAVLMSEEMGKLLTESIAEVEKCAWLCEYYAETGVEAISPIVRPSEAKNSFICFEPLGIVLAVMPWNFPFWQVFRCAVPNLLAGNAVLLKHATNVPGCALMLEHIFRDAGFPSNLFRSLLTKRDTVPELLK
ncbi:MAG: aldehyde dehydrogenase family protein, partial [Deltaproteobacteria bacterium]|nr:aldehyde dehydrogenase family protein [Deltaproteobacteria bacterium]